MIIRFGNHQIESDPLNITLYKISIGQGEKNLGQETKRFIGNFDSIGHMLRYCTKYNIRLSEAEKLDELQQDILRIEKFIEDFAAQIKTDIRKVETNAETKESIGSEDDPGDDADADESGSESGSGEASSAFGTFPNC